MGTVMRMRRTVGVPWMKAYEPRWGMSRSGLYGSIDCIVGAETGIQRNHAECPISQKLMG